MSDLDIDNGTVSFIDNNRDGEVDIVNVKAYENLYLTIVDTFDEKIYFKNGKVIDANRDVYLEVRDSQSGKMLSISDLVPESLVSVFAGQNGDNVVIYTNNKRISGVLNSVNDKEAVIDDTAYPFYQPMDMGIWLGKVVNVWIDFQGKLAMIDDNKKSTDALGFIIDIRVRSENTIDPVAIIKLLTENGEIESFYTDKNLYVDGERSAILSNGAYEKITPSNLIQVLTLAAEKAGTKDRHYSQLIRYSTNDDGRIINIDTANYQSNSEADNSLQLSKMVTGERIYCRTGRLLYNIDQGRTFCNASSGAKVFVVPSTVENRNNDDDMLSVKDGNMFVRDYYYVGENAQYTGIECFNSDDVQKSDVLVLYLKDNVGDQGSVAHNYRERVVAVDKVFKVLDTDGGAIYEIGGYANGGPVKYKLTKQYADKLSDGLENLIKHGDIIAVEMINGRIANIKTLFSFEKDKPYASISHVENANDAYTQSDASFFGGLHSCDGTYMSLEMSKTNPEDLLSFYVGGSQMTVLMYDVESGRYSTANINDFAGRTKTGFNSCDVYVYTNWGLPYLVIGYKK
jgi:hypothetical protein